MVVLSRAALAVLAVSAGCGSPSIVDGNIACGPEESCPADFSCAFNGRCYRGPHPDASVTVDAHAATDVRPPLDASPITLDCASYCDAIATACTSANQQYGSVEACVATCSYLAPGALTDINANTLGCRIYHTELARSSSAANCVYAGPSGGGVCGQPCETFCALVLAVCPGVYTPAECPMLCAQMSMTPPFSTGVQSGDSVSCRLFYTTAASLDAATNCPHVSASTSTMCQ